MHSHDVASYSKKLLQVTMAACGYLKIALRLGIFGTPSANLVLHCHMQLGCCEWNVISSTNLLAYSNKRKSSSCTAFVHKEAHSTVGHSQLDIEGTESPGP